MGKQFFQKALEIHVYVFKGEDIYSLGREKSRLLSF